MLSLRMLRRDWRAGELGVLALALVLAVAAVTSVGFFADRIRQALTRDAHQLLGGDLLMIADHPWDRSFTDELARRGLASAETQTFVSMARAGNEAQLVGLKAVSDGFPLRGRLRTAPAANVPDAEAQGVPGPGTVWIDERLVAMLSLKVGDTLELGEARFRVGAILTLEPDRSPSFINIAPRVMLRIEDLKATKLVQEGSRVQHSLLAAGEREAIRDFEAWAKARLGRGERIESLENARPEIRTSLERGEQFVGLTALLAVVLAAVAVALSTRRYLRRHLDGYAVMRCLAATQARLLVLATGEFAWLGLIACVIGCGIGYGGQAAIAALVAGAVGRELPPPSWVPALQGFATGFALLIGFALPPLLRLRHVPATRVLRRDLGPPSQAALIAWGTGLAMLAALLVWQARDVKMGLVVVAGFGTALGLFGAAAYAVIAVMARFAGAARVRTGLTWRYGLANLRRHAAASALQILALALGLTALLMLSFTRDDLLSTWRASVPPDAPDRFIVNIQPDQREPLEAMFRASGIEVPPIYPMVRGRITARNGQPVDADSYQERDRRLVEREFNLSYAERLPGHNRVASGRWFDEGDLARGALSVEADIARRLGWKLGDTLTWQVAGQSFTAPITSIRALSWDSMNVNFFVIGTPGLLREAPASFVTSFHLPGERAAFTAEVTRRFPNLTIIDTAALLRQLKDILDQVVRAVQFVFLFALGAGVLVLYAALLATRDERQHESAVMRALGASRSQVLAAQRVEFAMVGLVAGVLGAAGAVAIGWSIAEFVFHFPYRMNAWIWLAGPAAGLACVALNAWAGSRAVLAQAPLAALREA